MVIFNMDSKKGISPIVSVTLLLFVVVVAFTGISNWAQTFQNQMSFKAGGEFEGLKVEIKSLTRVSDNLSLLVVKNPSRQYIVIDSVTISTLACDMVYSNVVVDFGQIYLDCDVSVGSTYDIDILSTIGSSSKTLSVFD
jgi:hypothetical protein